MNIIEVNINKKYIFILRNLCENTGSTYEIISKDEEMIKVYITCQEVDTRKIINEINFWSVKGLIKKEPTKIQKVIAVIILIGVIIGSYYGLTILLNFFNKL